MTQTALSLMLVLVVQALMSVTLLACAHQDVCPYRWCEQPRDEQLPCDPQGAYIKMRCSVCSVKNVTVSWFTTKNFTDAGVDGNEIVHDGDIFILASDAVSNISFTSLFFLVNESTSGYYWCEINGTTLNLTSSSIVAVISNSSLPLCKNVSIPYNIPNNTNAECAVEGFSAAVLSSPGPSTTFYPNFPTEISFLPSVTLTTPLAETASSSTNLCHATSSSDVSSVITSTSFATTNSSSSSDAVHISASTRDVSSSTLCDFSTTCFPNASSFNTLVMTSLDQPAVSISTTPEGSVTIPIFIISTVVVVACLLLVLVATVVVGSMFCYRKVWYKQSSVSSCNSCLAVRSASKNFKHVSAVVNNQALDNGEELEEKTDLSKSPDVSSLKESHVYINSAVFPKMLSINSDEGYAEPKQLSDSTSSSQFEQDCTIRRGQVSTLHLSSYPWAKKSRSGKLDEGLMFANPTTESSAAKPEPEYADLKEVFSTCLLATNSQDTSDETQDPGDNSNGYTVPFGSVPASAKQRPNTAAYPPPTNSSSTVQYSHLKPLPENEADSKKNISSSGRSESTSEEAGYADPGGIKVAIPTVIKHEGIKPTSKAAKLVPPCRSNTLPQIELRTLGAPQDSAGKGQQPFETWQKPLHSPTASQYSTNSGQWTGNSSISASSLDENHYDDPWDLMKNIPTGVRRGSVKKRSATLRPRPKPEMIDSIVNDPISKPSHSSS